MIRSLNWVTKLTYRSSPTTKHENVNPHVSSLITGKSSCLNRNNNQQYTTVVFRIIIKCNTSAFLQFLLGEKRRHFLNISVSQKFSTSLKHMVLANLPEDLNNHSFSYMWFYIIFKLLKSVHWTSQYKFLSYEINS